MVVEENCNGLNPGEIPAHVLVPLSNEVGVYVYIGVGYKAEIMVLLSVEVEGDAITSNETRVLADCSWFITICHD